MKCIPVRFIVALLSACPCSYQVFSQTSAAPNIIFFFVDDMGWQESSVPFWNDTTLLNRRYRTPHMEQLAREGKKFTQAYAHPLCSPSRISLMTGMNAARHKVTNWTLRRDTSPDLNHPELQLPAWNINGLSPVPGIAGTLHAPTLPQLLRQAGYHTIHVGKAHFGARGTPGADPLNIGFEVNIGGHAAGGPGSFYAKYNFSAAWRNEDRIWDVPGLEAYHGKDMYLTEALTLEAIKAMERATKLQQPFFLYLSHYAVHAPFERDEKYYQYYIEKGLTPAEATYASMVEGMDKSLGHILEKVTALGIEQNTVVVFISDNGSSIHCPQNLPLRGFKINPYEGGIRVPMLVKWPGNIPPGSTSSTPLIIEDLFPTLLQFGGFSAAEAAQLSIDGKSIFPLLAKRKAGKRKSPLIWHFPHYYQDEPYSVIRQGDWKLIYRYKNSATELYNLAKDIGEQNNLVAVEKKVALKLSRRLASYLRQVNAGRPVVKASGQPCLWPDEGWVETN